MNSINRTEIGKSFVISTKSRTSVSFRFLIITTLTLIEDKGSLKAVSRDLRTASWPLRRVMSSNLNGSKVSRLFNVRKLISR